MAKQIKINWFGDMWEVSDPKEEETAKAEAKAVEEAVKSFILEEEGETPATMQELVMAVETARTPELQKFLEKNYIPFEDGTIIVSVK